MLIAKTRRIAADLGEIFRSRQARKIYWAVVEGVPKPAQGRISLFLAKGVGMGDERRPATPGAAPRDPEKMRVASHGDADAQHSLTYYAIVDKVAPRLRLAVDEADHRPHASIARPCGGDRPSDHRRSEIRPSARE